MSQAQWSAFDFYRDNVKLHCHTQGSGAPLVLLHGITDNGLCWGRTADALAQTYTVYALDLRGHGESDAPPSGYSYADNAADIVELLRVRGAANAIVLGHSYGGRIGMTLAAQYPQSVSKLILEDPPLQDPPADWAPDVLDRERWKWFEWLRNLKKYSYAELVAYCRAESPRWSAAECDAWANGKLQASPRLWETNGAALGGAWRATMRQISCPTLLVYGDTERGGLIDAAMAREAVGLLKQGEAAYVQDAGHSIHRDECAAFNADVNAFLQAV
ncbi:MAG: 2-succinyl-6-hydroxy-2,4-cyclohexadiene-1-carboxylate synthase [Anaerolineae bacterium]|nr:2-succinyl-6-hydroxy-2,4-cyclohexadiene-1-carboxylate synthase [Anaerolineae bacterium]